MSLMSYVYVKEDIIAIERHRVELYRAKDRYSVKLRMLGDDLAPKMWPSKADRSSGGVSSGSHSSLGGLAEGGFQNKKMDGKAQGSHGPPRKDALSGLDSHLMTCKNVTCKSREGYSTSLAEFQSVLSTFTRYSRLRVIAELRHGDPFHSANIVSSIEFDRDDQLFATTGVSRRIKVFDFSS
ncbi:E3 ubiquitin-protein ligase COP1, partial [Bienertia sinuspersici]